jgi:YVTN family beta-propeller protein
MTDAPLATIRLDMEPRWVAMAPDGRRAYVTMDGASTGAVAVIDTVSNSVTATIPIGILPGDVAVAPDGKRVFVSNFDGTQVAGQLSVIDTATDTVTADITVSGQGGGTKGVAVSPDGKTVYVCNEQDVGHERGRLSVIDTGTNTVTATVPVSSFPTAVRITPDGSRVYVIDTDGILTVVDTASGTATSPFVTVVGNRMAFLGQHAYVVRDADTLLSVLDTSTHQVTGLVEVDGLATDIAIAPDGQLAYVTQRTRSRLSVVDTATNLAKPFPVTIDGTADALTLTPDGKRAYISNRRTRTVEVVDL